MLYTSIETNSHIVSLIHLLTVFIHSLLSENATINNRKTNVHILPYARAANQ